MNIDQIRSLTEKQAQEMAIETTNVKGYTVYFVDCGEYFGYSYLVYKNNHHIHYVDDFALHHASIKSNDDLKAYYLERLNNKLFTEAELKEPLKSYDDYTAKSYFLHNYYAMEVDNVSAFYIVTEESKIDHARKTAGMTYDPIGFCYIKDKNFIEHHIELYEQLEALKNDVKNNYDYQKSAFKYEMFNHEYVINWQADYDVLSVFGNVNYHDDLDTMMSKLNFTDIQKRAYYDARNEVNREMEA